LRAQPLESQNKTVKEFRQQSTLFPAADSWALEGDPDDEDARVDDGCGGGGIARQTGYDLGIGML